ncbi:STAS domain-containing protein [Megalodesulfovibrio paquesii]
MEITFPPHCTVEHAQAIKATLLQALQAGGDVHCSFSRVAEADLSFFQLLTAARRSCEDAGVALICARDLHPDFRCAALATNWGDLIASHPKNAGDAASASGDPGTPPPLASALARELATGLGLSPKSPESGDAR